MQLIVILTKLPPLLRLTVTAAMVLFIILAQQVSYFRCLFTSVIAHTQRSASMRSHLLPHLHLHRTLSSILVREFWLDRCLLQLLGVHVLYADLLQLSIRNTRLQAPRPLCGKSLNHASLNISGGDLSKGFASDEEPWPCSTHSLNTWLFFHRTYLE